MENLNQIESEILNKIKSAKDRSAYDLIKTQIFGKKGIITELFKKISDLDFIYYSPLYYCLKRMLYINPQERKFLYI